MTWKKTGQRQADFWKNYMMITSICNMQKVFGCSIKEHLTTRRGMMFMHWHNPKAAWQCSQQVYNKILNDCIFIDRWLKEFDIASKNLLKISRDILAINLTKLSNIQLINLYYDFCQYYQQHYPPFHLAGYTIHIEDYVKNWLNNKLKEKNCEEKFEDYYLTLIKPTRLSLLQLEEKSLKDIAIKIKRKNFTKKQIFQFLKEHEHNFAGLPVINDQTKSWDFYFFVNKLKNILEKDIQQIKLENKELNQDCRQAIQQQKKIYYELNADELIKNLFKFLQISTWMRLVCRNIFAISHFSSINLFSEIGSRKKLKAEDIKWLTPIETKFLLLNDKKPNTKQNVERIRVSVLLYRNNTHTILEGEKAEKFIAEELKPVKFTPKKILKGQTAFQGIVKGAAKIVLDQKDISKIKKGDVLIARMTTPDLIPAIKKASAIVTDEGGITCHAAIVARELKIPCLIGTKYATINFNDNDIVLVDAKNGFVKLISQSD